MSDQQPTPEAPLEAPDLSMVALEDLIAELADRSPDVFILHMEAIEDAGKERFYRRFRGDWCRLVGVLLDLTSYCRERVKHLYPRPDDE